mmetsp:Transcript_31422/g.101595  ORF Transcript_31422/g.101595 Transcript_31422/m.101595 type:complete len:201 (+) Transcript_31422:1827-2429(+)
MFRAASAPSGRVPRNRPGWPARRRAGRQPISDGRKFPPSVLVHTHSTSRMAQLFGAPRAAAILPPGVTHHASSRWRRSGAAARARQTSVGSVRRAGRAGKPPVAVAAPSGGGETWIASLEAAATMSAQSVPCRMPPSFISIATMLLAVAPPSSLLTFPPSAFPWLLSSASTNLSTVEGGRLLIRSKGWTKSTDTSRDESK